MFGPFAPPSADIPRRAGGDPAVARAQTELSVLCLDGSQVRRPGREQVPHPGLRLQRKRAHTSFVPASPNFEVDVVPAIDFRGRQSNLVWALTPECPLDDDSVVLDRAHVVLPRSRRPRFVQPTEMPRRSHRYGRNGLLERDDGARHGQA